MALKATLTDRANDVLLMGLRQTRASLRLAITGRDKRLPAMREVRDFDIPGPESDLPSRLYRPETAPEHGGPVLAYFHGGGFVIGDLDINDALCRRLASAGGFTVIAVHYRLAPEAPYPAQLDDTLAAMRWIAANAAAVDVDATHLAIGGDSAGAYLAIAATARLNAETPHLVCAQILIYPLLHIDDAVWSTSVFADSRIVGRAAVAYIRSQIGPADIAAPSLLGQDLPIPPPTLVATGRLLDPVRPDALAYAAKLEALGARTVVQQYAPLPHGFANMTHMSAAARKAVAEIGVAAGELIRGD